MTDVRHHQLPRGGGQLQFASLNRTTSMVPRPGYFALSAGAGIRGRVARALWRALHRLGALRPYSETVEKWAYGPAEARAVAETIQRGVNDMLKTGRGDPEDWCIVMGGVVKWTDGRVQVTARLTVGAQDEDDFGNVDWSE